MILSYEELSKKIDTVNTCKNCKYSYIKDSFGEEFRCCKKFQYQDGFVNGKPRDIYVESDNVCDEHEEL